MLLKYLVQVTIVTLLVNIVCSQMTDLNYFPTHYRNLNKINKSVKSLNSNHNDLTIDSCGGIYRDKQAIIQSPRYPNVYPKNVQCVYTFYSPFVCTSEFHIQFLDFQLESSLTCSKDRLSIGNDEKLCGQVIGIMKYKAMNGILRINFTTDATIETKGFKLLVTRLPCVTDDIDIENNLIENPSTFLPQIEPIVVRSTTETQPIIAKNNNHPDTKLFVIPKLYQTESVPMPTNLKPYCTSQTHNNGLWPNQIPQSILSTSSLASCCLNVYNQKRFYIISAGFPTGTNYINDCLYFIERHNANVCRLRVEFKYFLLGDWQNQRCTNSFIEIDGKRFCGCKTGTVYFTQWGATLKTIRFANLLMGAGIQGFILDIVQEDCPYRTAQLPSSFRPQQFQVSINDPTRCSYDYVSWLQFNTDHDLLAKSVCIQNKSFGK